MAWKDKSDKYGQNAKDIPTEPCHFLRIKAKLIKVTEWLIHTQNREVDKGLFFNLLDLFLQLYLFKWGTAVAHWLRCCATNRKVAGPIPAGVSGFFTDIKTF